MVAQAYRFFLRFSRKIVPNSQKKGTVAEVLFYDGASFYLNIRTPVF